MSFAKRVCVCVWRSAPSPHPLQCSANGLYPRTSFPFFRSSKGRLASKGNGSGREKGVPRRQPTQGSRRALVVTQVLLLLITRGQARSGEDRLGVKGAGRFGRAGGKGLAAAAAAVAAPAPSRRVLLQQEVRLWRRRRHRLSPAATAAGPPVVARGALLPAAGAARRIGLRRSPSKAAPSPDWPRQ